LEGDCKDKKYFLCLDASNPNLTLKVGTIKTFFDDIYLWDQSGKPVKGKPAVFFCSHGGGGGKVKQPFESLAHRFFQQVGETLSSGRPISDEAKKKCHALGKELVQNPML
jgi:flavorubredoxin